MRLLRRLILLLSITVTPALGALWLRSASTLDQLSYKHTTEFRDSATAEGTLGAWVIRSIQHTLGPLRGSLTWTKSTFEALRDKQPDAKELAAFAAEDGLKFSSIDAASLAPDRTEPRFYHTSSDWRFGGFGAYPSAGGGMTHFTFEAPLWFLILLAVSPALLSARAAMKRRRRRRRGQCIHCGYDISKAMVVCPECGKDL